MVLHLQAREGFQQHAWQLIDGENGAFDPKNTQNVRAIRQQLTRQQLRCARLLILDGQCSDTSNASVAKGSYPALKLCEGAVLHQNVAIKYACA